MKNIVIIGARPDGQAKVVLEILTSGGEFDRYNVVGFIDDVLYGGDITIRDIPIIGRVSDLMELKQKLNLFGAIVAIGNNPIRRKIGSVVKECGLELINSIHSSAIIDSDVVIGEGNCFCQGVIIVTGTRIGDCVNIHTGATIDHDNIIEDGVNIAPGVHTSGRVHISQDAFIGTGSVIIPDCTIGEGVIIGAGSVVIKDVLPNTKVVGNPAKEIKK